MELLDRKDEIKLNMLRTLIKKNTIFSIDILANENDIGKRTILKYLDELSDDLTFLGLPVIFRYLHNNFLEQEIFDFNLPILQRMTVHYIKESIVFKLCLIVLKRKNLSLQKLADLLYLTYPTARRLIFQVNKEFQKFEFYICPKKVQFLGHETSIRLYFAGLFSKVYKQNELPFELINQDSFQKFLDTMKQKGFLMGNSDENLIKQFLALSIFRVRMGYLNVLEKDMLSPLKPTQIEDQNLVNYLNEQLMKVPIEKVYSELRQIIPVIKVIEQNTDIDSSKTSDVFNNKIIQLSAFFFNSEFQEEEKRKMSQYLNHLSVKTRLVNANLWDLEKLILIHPYKCINDLFLDYLIENTKDLSIYKKKEVLHAYSLFILKSDFIRQYLPALTIYIQLTRANSYLDKMCLAVFNNFCQTILTDQVTNSDIIITDQTLNSDRFKEQILILSEFDNLNSLNEKLLKKLTEFLTNHFSSRKIK